MFFGCNNDWLPEGDTTVKGVLQTIPQSTALCEYIVDQCKGTIAASSISKFPAAFNHILNFYDINNTVNKTTVDGLCKAMRKMYGKAPQATAAIPKKILRFLLKFLKRTDFNKFCFFSFAFLCATRVSEILNLKQSDFTFSPPDADRAWVRIHFRKTKTFQRFKEDGHSVTFTKPKRRLEKEGEDTYRIDPYALAQYWYQQAYKNKERFIAPFTIPNKETTSYATRSRKLYEWFSKLKIVFQEYLKNHKELDIDISNWRFHSIRTTYVGVMKQLGMSWEQIQVRTGHKWDSNVTRDTYFMNALLSEQFDDKFEQILTDNLSAQHIFLLENEPTDLTGQALDDQMHEEYYSSQEKKPAMISVLSTPKKRTRKKSIKQRRITRRIIPLGMKQKIRKKVLEKPVTTVFCTPGKTGKKFSTRRKKISQRQVPVNLTINRTHSSVKKPTKRRSKGITRERPKGSPHMLRTTKRQVARQISPLDRFATRDKGNISTPRNFSQKSTRPHTVSPNEFPPVSGCPWISSPQTSPWEKLFCHVYEKSKHEIPHEDEWLPPAQMPRTSPTPKKEGKRKKRKRKRTEPNVSKKRKKKNL